MAQKLTSRNRVAKEVLAEIIDGLNAGTLSVEKASEVAKVTLATLAQIEKHEDAIVEFYKNLASKYPNFKILYTRIRGEILKERELTAYRSALMAIDTGRIEEAKDIVEAAIDQSAHETTNI